MSRYIPRHLVLGEMQAQLSRRAFFEAKNKDVIAAAKDKMRAGETVAEFLYEAGFSPKHLTSVVVRLATELAKELRNESRG